MSGEQQTILIVEDELLIKEFMIAVLKDEGGTMSWRRTVGMKLSRYLSIVTKI